MNTTGYMHHYTECGLLNIWIGCNRVTDDAGKETVIIHKINQLHKLIAQTLVAADGPLKGSELKYLRSEMGLTPTELGKIIHRKPATISRWEKDDHRLDGDIDSLVRILAISKLKLGEVNPEKISAKWDAPRLPKNKIRIKITEDDGYRIAA